MSEQEASGAVVQEYVLYESEGEGVPFGDSPDETIVFQATSEGEALKLAAERYGINPADYYAQPVLVADYELFAVAPTASAFGLCTFVPSEDGKRAVAVFDVSNNDAKLLGFLDGEGQLVDSPKVFEADDDQALIDVTTRRWPFPESEIHGHMIVGLRFAIELANT